MFLTFAGPGGIQFGYVTEGLTRPFDALPLPRQFPHSQDGLCSWGSTSTIPEYSA